MLVIDFEYVMSTEPSHCTISISASEVNWQAIAERIHSAASNYLDMKKHGHLYGYQLRRHTKCWPQ